MVVQALIYLISVIIFLFCLYLMSREDFVFLRKSITIDDIFNVAFIVLLISLFFARVFYVVFNFKPAYLNPLIFFLVPYFPGLSLVGSVIGGILGLLIITKRKRFPWGRFLDFFAFAFLVVLPFAYAGSLLNGIKTTSLFAILPVVYYGFLLIFFLKILIPRFLLGQLRDGMMGLLILMNYSLFTAAVVTLQLLSNKASLITGQLISLMLLFLVSVFFFLRQGAQLSLKRTR